MIDFILSLPASIGCGIAMVSTSIMGLVVYAVSYKFIKKYKNIDLKDPITSLFRLVGILVSLMLSLAFGEVIAEWMAIKNAIDREAVAISDTYYNLKYYDSEDTREMQAILTDYARALIDDDWQAMANDRLGQRASTLKRQFTKRLLELKPENSLQEELRSGIMADIDMMSDYRLIRLNRSCFGAYQPHTPIVTLLSLFMLFIGMVVYLIMSMSDPFEGGAVIDPTPIKYLIETLTSEIN